MLQHNVEYQLHAALVHFVDKFLESSLGACGVGVLRHIAVVDLGEVDGVIAVVVEAGGVLYHGSNPHGSEAERLDVVEFVDKTFEVASPFGVVDVLLAVPAVDVVAVVTVVETGCHGEIDGFVAEVGAVAHKSSRRYRCHCRRGHDCAAERMLEKIHGRNVNVSKDKK